MACKKSLYYRHNTNTSYCNNRHPAFCESESSLQEQVQGKDSQIKGIRSAANLFGLSLIVICAGYEFFLISFSDFLFSHARDNIAVFFSFSSAQAFSGSSPEKQAGQGFFIMEDGGAGKTGKAGCKLYSGRYYWQRGFRTLLSFNWSFNKYFVLVSEVLDKSGETSYLGFKLLAYYLMFISSISLGILGGLITALSPTYKTTRQRIVRFIFPAMLLAVLISVIAGTYQNAVTNYDLGKKNLAEAVGIPEKASVSKTIIMFTPNKIGIQEWPLKIEVNNLMGTNTIELSYENLKKVEGYVAGHKEGSVYNYTACEASYERTLRIVGRKKRN